MRNTRMHLFTTAIPFIALLLAFNTAAAQITVNSIPSALPSNILAYVPINIYNQMPSSTPNGFQQMLAVNASAFSAYEAANLENVGFFYSNGTFISSWLKSGSSTSLSVYWLRLNPQIPSNGFISIFIGFASPSTALPVPNDTSGAAQPSMPNATMPFSVYGHLSSTQFNSSDIHTTLASNSIVVGQSESITASVTGGTGPYTYQWRLNGANVGTNSNTLVFNGNLTTLAGSPDNVTVLVHDALGTIAQNGTRIRVAMAPLITLTPNHSVLDSGQSVTFNIMITGGIGPFNVELYNITGSRRQAANITILSPGTSGIVNFPVSYINTTAPNSILTLSFNAFATDLGSGSTGIFSSLPSTITVHTSPNVSIMDPVVARAAAAAAAARAAGDPTLTISSSPGNGGITSPTSGAYNISGTATMLTIIASPKPGYMFTGWAGTGPGSYTGSNPFETVPINSNITEVADFQQTTYTLTITNNGCTSISGAGTFNALSSQQISATVPTGYSLAWAGTGTGSYTGANNPATVTMDSNIAETATCIANPEQLTMSVSPSGDGTVSPGSGSYIYGTTLTISETPASGYTFTGWTGSGTGSYTGSSSSQQITMNSNIIETANFQQTTYTLTITNNGCTSVSGAGTYPSGASEQISAVVPTGDMLSWSGTGTGSYTGSSNPATVTMNGIIVETATCSATAEQLTMSASPAGSGTVSPGNNQYSYGTTVTLSETPAYGYLFTGWTGSGTGSYSGSSTNPQITMDGPITEVADFQTAYTLTTINDGCTSVSASSTYASGSSVQISATVPAGYSLAWSGTGTGSYSGTSNPATVTMNADVLEVATCAENTEQLTMSASPSNGGTVSPGTQAYLYSTAVQISETPASGYTFTGWTGTGTGSYSGLTTSPQITMDANIVEVANFQQVTYTLTITNNGCTSVTGPGTYSSGSSQQISAIVPSGHSISWSGTGTGSYTGASNPATVTMNGNIAETATCTAGTQQLTMSVSPSGAGTVSPGNNQYSYGTTVTLSETPGSGYIFTGWTGTGTGSYTGTSASPQITMDSSITEVANFVQTYAVGIRLNPGTTTGWEACFAYNEYEGATYITHNETCATSTDASVSTILPSGSYVTAICAIQTAGSLYTFSNWTVSTSGVVNPTECNNGLDIPITSAITWTANFKASTYSVTIQESPSGAASYWNTCIQYTSSATGQTVYPQCAGMNTINNVSGTYEATIAVPQDSVITEICSADYGATNPYQLSSYTINGGPALPETPCTNTYDVEVTGSTTVAANFQSGYTLTESASPDGTGGVGTSNPTIDGTSYPCYSGCTTSATVSSGSTTTLSETPDPGYLFTEWAGTGPGSYTGTNPAPEITIDGNIDEVAEFAKAYTVTILESPSGAASYWGACFDYYLPSGAEQPQVCAGPSTGSSVTVSIPSGSVMNYLCTADWVGGDGYSFTQFINQGDAGAYSIDGSSCSNVVVYINQDYTETAQYSGSAAGGGGASGGGGGGGDDGGGGDGGDGGG